MKADVSLLKVILAILPFSVTLWPGTNAIFSTGGFFLDAMPYPLKNVPCHVKPAEPATEKSTLCRTIPTAPHRFKAGCPATYHADSPILDLDIILRKKLHVLTCSDCNTGHGFFRSHRIDVGPGLN